MTTFAEKDLLRLSMIFENSGATTRDRYICKFVEYILFDAQESELTSSEICLKIRNRFFLEFDISEIEAAIKSKGRGRIIKNDQYYQLNVKTANQLAGQIPEFDKFKSFLTFFSSERTDIDADALLNLIQNFLYYCFNSNVNNFLTLINGNSAKIQSIQLGSEFNPSSEEIDIINEFLRWENADKNKYLYSIISSCYEYCLITSNKNPSISKSIFRGKKFFLDTNIIFRLAGFNKDERKFVSKTFVRKCKEVGITLCYSSAVLNEVYRVIDAQIKYINLITNAQPPVKAELLSKLTGGFEINDFYLIYYEWCKDPQNRYNDYTSFRRYLIGNISRTIEDFEYVDSTTIDISTQTKQQLFDSLKQYKDKRRPYNKPTDDSIKTDVAQVLYINLIRPKKAKKLWDMNEYIVSADQLFIAWSEENFNGIPIVVIPSLWLSIILKVSGRATDDDYKSFCMFMTLRHFHTKEDDININPVKLLSVMSQKTVDSRLKENIMEEILQNRENYSFDNPEDYETSIDCAFDQILKQEKDLHKEELLKAVEAEREIAKKAEDKYSKELKDKISAEEYAQIYSQRKAKKKVEWFSRRAYIPLIVNGAVFIVALILVFCWILNIKPISSLLKNIIESENKSDKIVSAIIWVFNLCVLTLPTYIGKVWEYLSSDKRREKLCSKYFKQQIKMFDDK